MRRTIIAVYDDQTSANHVVNHLVEAGIDRSNIGFAMNDPDSRGAKTLRGEEDVDAGEGASFGAMVGGLTGLLVGLGSLLIPGVGPVIAAGPLIAGLGGAIIGAGTGALTGGIVAALVDLGVPEEEASYYAEAVRRGSTLVTATVHEDMLSQATEIMRRHNPIDLDTRVTQWRAKGWESFDPKVDPYTAEELATERTSYSSSNTTGSMSDSATRHYSSGYDQWHDNFYGHWNSMYSTSGRPYLYYMPAYRQGYALASDPRYKGRSWDEIETDARSYWEQSNRDTLWDDIKDAVRHAWEQVKDAVGAE